jgi:hypothetical protein
MAPVAAELVIQAHTPVTTATACPVLLVRIQLEVLTNALLAKQASLVHQPA